MTKPPPSVGRQSLLLSFFSAFLSAFVTGHALVIAERFAAYHAKAAFNSLPAAILVIIVAVFGGHINHRLIFHYHSF